MRAKLRIAQENPVEADHDPKHRVVPSKSEELIAPIEIKLFFIK